jgi:hypothetical protein
MKKILVICLCVVLIILIAVFVLYVFATAPKYEGEFLLEVYEEEIKNQNFQMETTYGEIIDYKFAAKVGQKAISDRFSDAESSLLKWRGCLVSYDKENDVYHVLSYPIAVIPMFGGSYEVLIKSDGTILAIWGNK